MNTILSVCNVTQTFDGKKVLDDLTLEFWQGHIHAVIGPNGAGKSTLANTVMGCTATRATQATSCSKASRCAACPWMNARSAA